MDFLVLSEMTEVAMLEALSPVALRNETGLSSVTGSLSFGRLGVMFLRFFFERRDAPPEVILGDLFFFEPTFFLGLAGSLSGGCMFMDGNASGRGIVEASMPSRVGTAGLLPVFTAIAVSFSRSACSGVLCASPFGGDDEKRTLRVCFDCGVIGDTGPSTCGISDCSLAFRFLSAALGSVGPSSLLISGTVCDVFETIVSPA